MEIFIYCYLTVSYLVMFGYDNAIHEYEGYSLKNKEEAAVLVLIVLSAPAILPFIIGGKDYCPDCYELDEETDEYVPKKGVNNE